MLDVLRGFARRLIEHPHYKVLAVLLALTTWWYVQASEVDERRVRVAVTWITPQGLVTTEPLPGSVGAVLKGSRNALRRVDEADLELIIDCTVAASEIGEHSLDLSTFGITGLPVAVDQVEIRPNSVTFTLDEVDVRSVTVQPVVVGEPREGWMVAQTRIEPSVVEVLGPAVALKNLTSVSTRPIDVSGLRHDKRFETLIDLPSSVEVVGVDTVEARVDIEPQLESRVFAEVPIYVRNQRGWIVDPASVRVRVQGPAASLREISDADVVGQVYLPDVPSRFTYEARFGETDGIRGVVTLPSESVEVVSVEPIQVRVYKP